MIRARRFVLTLALLAALAGASKLAVFAYFANASWPTPSAVVYVNPQNLDVTSDAAETALQAAMDAWNQAGSTFRFTYGGRVTDTTMGFDGRNVAIFRNASSGSAIATTYYWTSASGNLLDADVVFWDGGFTFFTGTSGCGGFGAVYLEDVATHELGHVLGLGHSTDSNATMFPTYSPCSQNTRTLAADDIAGVRALYGSSVPNTPPTVTITSPASGAVFVYGTVIAFLGSASDAEDGTLTDRMAWTSSIDGSLGSGGSVSRALSVGTHDVTASVTDNLGSTSSRHVTVTVTPPGGTTATFAGTDTTTRGNWKGTYGAEGHGIADDLFPWPAYATVTRVGAAAYTWATSTSDPRALLRTLSATDRVASTWYGNFDTHVGVADSVAHRVSLYLVDYDRAGRAETIDILDTATGGLLDRRAVSDFGNGVYLSWDVKGPIIIRLRVDAGSNAVYSGVFFDPTGPPPPGGASASFVGADVTTQGNWQGAYGVQGYTIANDSAALPAFATVTPAGGETYTWAGSTSDARALLKSSSTTDRIASTWYGNFDTQVTVSDAVTHKVSLYLVDYDRAGRAETIDLLDASTGALLDRRAVSNFSNGVYLSWDVKGAIVVRLRADAGSNAVYSAVFFDPSGNAPPPPPPGPVTSASFLGVDSITQGSWKGAYGSLGYTIANDATSLPAFAAVTPVGGQTYTWAASTFDVRALLKSSSTTDRIASTWYTNFDTVITFSDPSAHKVSLYLVDYDRAGRAQTIDILDAATGALLDRRAVSGFASGVYLSWNVTGAIVVRLRVDAGSNAVYSGVFLD